MGRISFCPFIDIPRALGRYFQSSGVWGNCIGHRHIGHARTGTWKIRERPDGFVRHSAEMGAGERNGISRVLKSISSSTIERESGGVMLSPSCTGVPVNAISFACNCLVPIIYRFQMEIRTWVRNQPLCSCNARCVVLC